MVLSKASLEINHSLSKTQEEVPRITNQNCSFFLKAYKQQMNILMTLFQASLPAKPVKFSSIAAFAVLG